MAGHFQATGDKLASSSDSHNLQLQSSGENERKRIKLKEVDKMDGNLIRLKHNYYS